MSYQIRFTKAARDDIKRFYAFLLVQDIQAAKRALEAINKAMELLKTFPFTCRKAKADNPFLRELIISFGANETLSSFVEESLRANIERRLHSQAFIARGIASRDEAKISQEYYSAESVLAELPEMLKKAQQV